MKCPRCNGNLIKDYEDIYCLAYGFHLNLQDARPLALVDETKLVERHISPSLPFFTKDTIREMVEIVNGYSQLNPERSKEGVNASFRTLGRPRTFPKRNCKECGEEIDPRPYRGEVRRRNQLRNLSKIFEMYKKHVRRIDKLVKAANRSAGLL